MRPKQQPHLTLLLLGKFSFPLQQKPTQKPSHAWKVFLFSFKRIFRLKVSLSALLNSQDYTHKDYFLWTQLSYNFVFHCRQLISRLRIQEFHVENYSDFSSARLSKVTCSLIFSRLVTLIYDKNFSPFRVWPLSAAFRLFCSINFTISTVRRPRFRRLNWL